MKEDKFMRGASDKKGHSVRIQARIPTETAHLMDLVFDSGKYPYQTKAEIIRDALAHRLDWLVNNAELPRDDLVRLQTINNILESEKYRKSFVESLNELQKEVDWLLAQGDKHSEEHAAELVNSVMEQIYEMHGYWHDKALGLMRSRFGRLIKPWSMQERSEQ